MQVGHTAWDDVVILSFLALVFIGPLLLLAATVLVAVPSLRHQRLWRWVGAGLYGTTAILALLAEPVLAAMIRDG